MTRDDDHSYVRDALAGEVDAFAVLVRRHDRVVYNVAYRITRDREEARDVTQTVFVRAFESLSRFDFRSRFFSWIYRIAVNESIRASGRKRRIADAAMDDLDFVVDSDAESGLESRERSTVIRSALLALRADDRALLTLRHYLQYSYRDIGGVLGIAEKTVKSRLFTARARLRDELERLGYVGR
jgi:RNA polymerase sigma-70 factor (ECF subfamily)